jgi:hypothetical protein
MVLVKGSQVWREPRAISVPVFFYEWGMLSKDGEESTCKE